MTVGEILSIAGFCIVAVGLIATWVRNGRNQSKRDGILEERINNLSKKLDDENTGLGAIKKCVDKQAIHCAGITGSFEERIKGLEERD
ncbi:hypothetical protein ES705_33376 [subsurface metagenome]